MKGQKRTNGKRVSDHPRTDIPASEPWEPVFLEELRDPEKARAYLNYCLREGDLSDVLAALQSIAKAQGGFSKLARETGLSRVNLYSALSETGNPRFDSISKVLHSLGWQVAVEPLHAKDRTSKLVKSRRSSSTLS
jgi:probable addiction module antidote protein